MITASFLTWTPATNVVYW